MLKIIVVDDEDLIRKGLIKILKKTGVGLEVIGEACNGIQALKILESEIPDLLITDIKMPEMNGIELIKNMEISYPKVKKIVLSGFDEFNYVRDTMRNGALDYLLKPIDDLQLAELLRKVEAEINEEKRRRLKELNLKVRLNESMPLLREQFITELILNNNLDEAGIKKKFDYYGINLSCSFYRIIIVSIDNYRRLFEKLGAEDTKLKAFVMRNIVEETMAQHMEYLSCVINSELVIVAALKSESDEGLKETLEAVYGNIMQYAKARFTISVGRAVRGLDHLKESYDFAVDVLKYRFYNDNSGIIDEKSISGFVKMKHNGEILANYGEKFEGRLKNCVELANAEPLKDIIDEFALKLREFQADPAEAKKLFTHVYMKLLMDYQEFKKAASEIHGMDFSYLKHVEGYDTLDEIKSYTCHLYAEIIRQIVDIRKRKDKKLVEIVKDYILKHYNEDVTLNRIAEVAYVNSSYICDLFKTQTGENFVDYLTKIRIEKAKVLLRDVRIKTYEVGQKVGYEDATYFSKVFKKVVGVSPSEYRNIVE